jgi:hypothetical protein
MDGACPDQRYLSVFQARITVVVRRECSSAYDEAAEEACFNAAAAACGSAFKPASCFDGVASSATACASVYERPAKKGKGNLYKEL